MRSTRLVLMLMVVVPLFGMAQEGMCPTSGSTTSTKYLAATVDLKILLVEFSDVKHRNSPNEYTITDFENLLVSQGIFVTPNMTNADGEPVYGSMRDYYNLMSNGNLTITGRVVNYEDVDDIPEWIPLPHTKSEYDIGNYVLETDAVAVATSYGLDVGGLGDDVKLVIIYAGNVYYNHRLNPHANGIPGTIYIASERNGNPHGEEHSTDSFGRLGIHCHEFAHLLGIGHASGSRADIMEAGRRNGPYSAGSNGSAPAPLNPAHRALKGWANVIPVNTNGVRTITYSLANPDVYRIDSNVGGDYYLIENRRFDGTMTIGSTNVPDYNNATFMPIAGPHYAISHGLLVWRIQGGNPSSYSNNGLVYASGLYGLTYPEQNPSETDDGDPFPGVSNATQFHPWSDARTPLGYDQIAHHYYIFVPNSKPSTNVGVTIVEDNPQAGYIRADLFSSNPPNPANDNQSTSSDATKFNSQRKLLRNTSGQLDEVFVNGGEVFYRKSFDGATWQNPIQLSDGYGRNEAPCIARTGNLLVVAWQKDNVSSYRVLLRRSTDGGTSWIAQQILQSTLVCPMPGPVPSVSAYSYGGGTISVVYRRLNELAYVRSTNGGAAWSVPSQVPSTQPRFNSPSTGTYSTYWGTPQVNVVYATDFPGSINPPQIMYNYLEPQYPAWGSPINISSIVPEVSGHANPSIGVSVDEVSGIKIQHVAWDVQNYAYHGPSIIYRQGQFRSFGSVYSVFWYQSQDHPSITGLSGNRAALVFQNTNGGIWKRTYDGSNWTSQTFVGNGNHAQISVGSSSAKYLWTEGTASPYTVRLSTETLNKTIGEQTIAENYGRAISLTNPTTGAFFTVEVEVIGEQRESSVWSNPVTDTASLTYEECLDALSLSISAVSTRGTLPLKIRVASKGMSQLAERSPKSLVLSIMGSSSDKELETVDLLSLDDKQDGILHSFEASLNRDDLLAGRKTITLRPRLVGFEKDAGVQVGLAHIYASRDQGSLRLLSPSVSIAGNDQVIPDGVVVEQNFPQPFNPETTIRFGLPEASEVSIRIVDMQGREVETLLMGQKTAGFHQVSWQAGQRASGTYICRMKVLGSSGKKYEKSMKLILAK